MNVADFNYDLPTRYIAQTPAQPRDSSKLLQLNRETGAISHYKFSDIIELLAAEDVLVLNKTRVIPARLRAVKAESGGTVEILLLKQLTARRWQALVGGRNVKVGMRLTIPGANIDCTVIEQMELSQRIVAFGKPLREHVREYGEMPLPPYIHTALSDSERYQTVYGETEGSAAAPTAGLHFTAELLAKLERKGVRLASCTLHIGLDTFQPVTVERVRDHKIHSEYALLDRRNASVINAAKQNGGRIVAVGTTSARVLETAAILSTGGDPRRPDVADDNEGDAPVRAFEAATSLFIYPGYKWRVVDAMITNFHLPRSTLLMMLSSFVGRDTLLGAYETAKRENYRFYSFGDAMFIT